MTTTEEKSLTNSPEKNTNVTTTKATPITTPTNNQEVPLTSPTTALQQSNTTVVTVVTPTTNNDNSLVKKSIKEKLQDAKENESGIALFIAVAVILIGFVGCTIFTVLFSIIPILMIYYGSTYIDDCPAGKYIPIYLVVGGVIGLISQVLNWCKCHSKNRKANSKVESSKTHVLDVFNLAWFIAGSYWVYSIYKPSYIPGDIDYCHKTTYLLAFSLITMGYCFLLLLPLACCCICLAFCCLSTFVSDSNDDVENTTTVDVTDNKKENSV